jgi:hypothetical protein
MAAKAALTAPEGFCSGGRGINEGGSRLRIPSRQGADDGNYHSLRMAAGKAGGKLLPCTTKLWAQPCMEAPESSQSRYKT